MVAEPVSPAQRDKFWAICTALEKSPATWAGERQPKVAWYDLLLHAWALTAGLQPRMVPGLEGGVICLRGSIRKLSWQQASELLDYAAAWAAQHGVELKE